MRVVRGGVWHRGVFSGVIWTQVSYPEVAAGRNERHMKASRGPTNDVPAAGHFDATVGGSVSTSPRVTRARCFFVFGVRVFVSVSVSVSVSVVGSLCFSRSSSIGRRIGCEFCWLPACSRWFRFESCIEYCHSANTHNERKIASYLWGRLGLSFYRTVWRGWAKSVLLKNTASSNFSYRYPCFSRAACVCYLIEQYTNLRLFILLVWWPIRSKKIIIFFQFAAFIAELKSDPITEAYQKLALLDCCCFFSLYGYEL